MQWTVNWKYLPVNYGAEIGVIHHTTQRTIFRSHLSGKQSRIKLSNLYSPVPLVLGQVTAAVLNADGEISSSAAITRDGASEITLRAGEECYSDPIPLPVRAGQNIGIFVYIEQQTSVYSASAVWSVRNCMTQYHPDCPTCMTETSSENWKESMALFPSVSSEENRANLIIGISEVSVLTDDSVKTIALFGDSITHMSYFSDALYELLDQTFPRKVSLANYGIGGNRLLRNASFLEGADGNGICFGPSGISRFETDVFSGDGSPDCIILLEGINDIMHPYEMQHPEETVSSAELKSGMLEVISIAHRHLTPIFCGTVMPFQIQPEKLWYKEAEQTRLAFNHWMQTESPADGILDFAAAVAQETNVSHMRNDLHLGDGLHPNSAGGFAMARVALPFLHKILAE